MKRNAFLIAAMFFSMTAGAMAAEQKQDVQLQSESARPVQLANNSDASMTYAPSAKADCTGNTEKPNKTNSDPKEDPPAAQNQVEYGGAG